MDYGPLITATSAILVAIISGVITVILARKKQTTDVQASLQAGFQLLITKLQEERVALTEKIEDQATQNAELQAEVSGLQKTVRKLEAKIDTIIRKWRAGEQPPPEEDETKQENRT